MNQFVNPVLFSAKSNNEEGTEEQQTEAAKTGKRQKLKKVATAPWRAVKAIPRVAKNTPTAAKVTVKSTPDIAKSTWPGIKKGGKEVKSNYKTTFNEGSIGSKAKLVGSDVAGLAVTVLYLPFAWIPGPNPGFFISKSIRKFGSEFGTTIYEESGMKERMKDELAAKEAKKEAKRLEKEQSTESADTEPEIAETEALES